MTLQVVGGNDYLVRQEARLRRASALLEPAGSILVPVAFVAWVFVLVLLQLDSLVFLRYLMASAGILSVGAFVAPRLAEQTAADAARYAQGIDGEQRFVALLEQHLDSEWTLFRNVLLPDKYGDIDAILVGATGVFVLEVKTWNGVHRASGMTWERRTGTDQWRPSRRNPLEQAQRNQERLQTFFAEHEIEVALNTRLVWAGEGTLLPEDPAIPIWQVTIPEAITSDLAHGDGVDIETFVKLKQTLLRLQNKIATGEGG